MKKLLLINHANSSQRCEELDKSFKIKSNDLETAILGDGGMCVPYSRVLCFWACTNMAILVHRSKHSTVLLYTCIHTLIHREAKAPVLL